MVPNGWRNLPLEQIAKFRRGSFPQPYGNPAWIDEKSGYPFVQVFDIAKNMLLKTNTKIKISDAAIGKSVFIPKGTVIVSIQGSIGRVAITQYDAYVDRTILLFQEFTLPTDTIFFAYQIQELFEIEKTKAPGGTIKTITKEVLRKFTINLPPLPEQQKIATILGTWDNAISTTERLIDNSKQQKKALMQQLLTGKKRLLDDSGKPFEGEWEELNLGSIGTIHSGGTPSTTNKEYWDGDINWITPTDITKQSSVYINSSLRKISSKGLKNSSAKLVPKGSLLVCTRATIGEMAITAHDMCTNQGFKNIIPNKKGNIVFVYYLLNFYKHRLISKASGSTFLELSKSAFEGITFNFPVIEEQHKIASVLTIADKEIDLLEQQLSDLKQEKKALMQQLLTGKRRVTV